MTVTAADEPYLRRAIELAASANPDGERPYGAVLVADGAVIAEARNTVPRDRDITAHPELELELARWAARELGPAADSTTPESRAECAETAHA